MYRTLKNPARRISSPPPGPSTRNRIGTVGTFGIALAVSTLLLAGCGSGSGNGTNPDSQDHGQLLLSGPKTDIVVAIPGGWHQVIDSANPIIPEMVTPTTCMGSEEVSCATGLARIASITAPDAQAAAQTIEQAVYSMPGVKPGATISQGPGKVGRHDGYRHRFTFSNTGGTLTSEIAAVPSGPTAPDAQGNHEFSVVLIWVSDKSGAPKPDVIDQIISSALVSGGQPPTS
jgi:hypothetical protein